MCCVCDKSSAASISSRMYIGAGLNCKRDIIKERAMSDLEIDSSGKRVRLESKSYLLTSDPH